MKSDILRQYGLDESEAAVYAALLQIGTASVSQITKNANITRTLGYHVLDKLLQKQLIDEVITTSKKTYKAKHPRYLKQYVDKQKKQWENRSLEIGTLLPEFVELYATDCKPTIRYQEGAKGVKGLYEEKLQSTTDILSVLDVESWKIPEFWDWTLDYHKRRLQKKIQERVLLLDTPEGRTWFDEYKGKPKHTSYRWVSKEYVKKLFQFGGGIDIYEDNVMISILQGATPSGLIIEGKVLANILRALFELAWESAEPAVFKK